jgi:hypothetical protein
MINRIFNNKRGIISLVIYIITFIISSMYEQPTIFFFIILMVSAISGFFFSIWLLVKLVNYFIDRSKK